MTKIDKLKAKLIDIIGERKTVKIKELSHLARSTQLIDELMDKIGYHKYLHLGVYELAKQEKNPTMRPMGVVSVKYGDKVMQFHNNGQPNITLDLYEYLAERGSITTAQLDAMDFDRCAIDKLRKKGFDIHTQKLAGHNYEYTLKSPKR